MAYNSPDHVTLESINEILIDYINDIIQPHIIDNDKQRAVPILYGTPERWASIRKLGFLRDAVNDKLLTPAIMLQRTGVTQGKMINPNNKYLYRSVSRQWNVANAYDRFAVQNRIIPSHKIHNVLVPDYVDLQYDVIMWTEYQEQMGNLIEQINIENYEYWGKENNYKFRISINEFASDDKIPASDNRVVKTNCKMIVNAYLLPERMIKNFRLSPTTNDVFTNKKIIIDERVVSTGDINSPQSNISIAPDVRMLLDPYADRAHFYEFKSSFTDSYGGPLISGSMGGLTFNGYNFTPSQSLSLSNAVSASQYTISMYTSLINNANGSATGYQKLIDFNNRTSDTGIYISKSSLLYNDGNYNFASYPSFKNTPYINKVVLTRDENSVVSVYLNGKLEIKVTDISGVAIFNSVNNVINFFADDVVTGFQETATGTVRSISIWNRPLSSKEILYL